ncbi:MAG: hypothetical protein DRQ88_07480 [Epsilonproteobacteria bacterium]|nr:MAG: hypothetical protein DRQ88_07480 [Campylobacterota bacterium]
MKKNILIATLLTLVTFSASAKEGHLNPYWFGDSIDKSADQNDNLNSIDSFLNGVVDSTVGALNEFDAEPVAKATKNGWHLAGFQTSLGVGFSGNIGILAFGGTKIIEIDWARKKQEKKEKEEELESSLPVVTINENHTKADLNKALDPVVRQLVETGRVKDEKEFRKNLSVVSNDFYAYAKGLSTTRSNYVWRAGKIRLDLNFSASGKIATAGPLVKLGVDVKLRLEFARIMAKAQSDNKAMTDLNAKERKIARETRNLLDSLSYEVTKSYDELEKSYNMDVHDMSFKIIEVALGMSVEGSVGVAKLKGSVVPSVFFTRHKLSSSTPAVADKAADNGTINLIVDNSDAGIAVDKGLKESIFKLKRKRIRKGMKKAMKFAYKFAKKMSKKAKKRQERMAQGRRVKMPKWIVKKIRSQYKFEVGGSIGPVKLKAIPHLSIYWVNKIK